MRNKAFFILINVLLVILQTSFFIEICGFMLNPNLTGALVFGFLLVDEVDLAYTLALTGGLLLDILSGGVVGLSAFILVLFVWLYKNLSNFYLRNIFAKLLMAMAFFYILQFDGHRLPAIFFTVFLGFAFSLYLKSNHEKNLNF